jgi:hypothetical protein
MIFANNECVIKENKTNFSLKFNAVEALKFINHEHRKHTFSGPEDM